MTAAASGPRAAGAAGGGVAARLERLLTWVNGALLSVGMVALVFFSFAQAVDRYTIKTKFDAHDQLARVGLVWVVFCGMALGYAARENLRIDLLARRMPLPLLRAREALFEFVVFAVCVLLHWKAWAVIEVAGMQPIMGTPFTNALPHSAILLGTLSIAFTCLLRLWRMAHGRWED
ncbi:MAG: tripartite ATP-independent periplasmic transporter, DctQ component family protein 11 [Ramlibacter sp.]|nr:tripartite ATP-independent periplasmic transporter, DctQ component family protein 11 [Ramlibacter sp.]